MIKQQKFILGIATLMLGILFFSGTSLAKDNNLLINETTVNDVLDDFEITIEKEEQTISSDDLNLIIDKISDFDITSKRSVDNILKSNKSDFEMSSDELFVLVTEAIFSEDEREEYLQSYAGDDLSVSFDDGVLTVSKIEELEFVNIISMASVGSIVTKTTHKDRIVLKDAAYSRFTLTSKAKWDGRMYQYSSHTFTRTKLGNANNINISYRNLKHVFSSAMTNCYSQVTFEAYTKSASENITLRNTFL